MSRRDRPRRSRFGLAAKLYIAIGGAVAITVAASVVAWLSFVRLGEQQNQITEQLMPTATEALLLAQQSAAIAAAAPELMSVEAESERLAATVDLRRQHAELMGRIEELRPRGAGLPMADEFAFHLSEIASLAGSIRRSLDHLDLAVQRRLLRGASLDRLTAAATAAHRRMDEVLVPLLDDATFYLVTGYRSLDESPDPPEARTAEAVLLRYQALNAVAAEANRLAGLLAEAANQQSIEFIGPQRERFDASAGRLRRALDALGGAAGSDRLARLSDELIEYGTAAENIFLLRRDILAEQLASHELLEASRGAAGRLAAEVSALVIETQAATAEAVAESRRAADTGRTLLLALNALAILGAVAIAWGYVGRRLTGPVVRVTAAAEAFEAQRFDPAALADVRARTDELGALARTFTRMAEEVQARTEILDRLVAQRTEELNQKNDALERTLQRLEDELTMAQRMQLSLLPRAFPERADMAIFARMRAAREVGGDFYDVIEIDEDRVGLVIADVSGKGVPAALFMAVSLTVLRTAAARGGDPAEVLRTANQVLAEENDAMMFVTVFYGIVSRRTGTLTYANAGHNPPFLLRANGALARVEPTGDVALGVMEDLGYGNRVLDLDDGDTLFCYTDGITEAFDPAGNEFSETRLAQVLYRSNGLSVERVGVDVMRQVEAFASTAPQSDDITCLVMRYNRPVADAEPMPQTDMLVARIRGDLGELARLAEQVEDFCGRNGLPARLAFNLNLVVDELVTNTVSYGYDDDPAGHAIDLRLRREGEVLSLEVEDDGRPYNPLDAGEPDLEAELDERAVGGLGIHLVKTIMDSINYRRVGERNLLAMTKRMAPGEGGEEDDMEETAP